MKSIFTEEYERLIAHLVAARKSAGVTQEELARRLGKHQSFVSKYERRERRIDVVEFAGICAEIGVDAHEVLDTIVVQTHGRGTK